MHICAYNNINIHCVVTDRTISSHTKTEAVATKNHSFKCYRSMQASFWSHHVSIHRWLVAGGWADTLCCFKFQELFVYVSYRLMHTRIPIFMVGAFYHTTPYCNPQSLTGDRVDRGSWSTVHATFCCNANSTHSSHIIVNNGMSPTLFPRWKLGRRGL